MEKRPSDALKRPEVKLIEDWITNMVGLASRLGPVLPGPPDNLLAAGQIIS